MPKSAKHNDAFFESLVLRDHSLENFDDALKRKLFTQGRIRYERNYRFFTMHWNPEEPKNVKNYKYFLNLTILQSQTFSKILNSSLLSRDGFGENI